MSAKGSIQLALSLCLLQLSAITSSQIQLVS